MSKRKRKRIKKQLVKYKSNSISQEKLIEIQAEAYYRALKRIENDANEADKKEPEKKKHECYYHVLFGLNAILWPWKINKKFRVNNRIYDSILVLFVSGALQVIGGIIWLLGILTIVNKIWQLLKLGIISERITAISIGIVLLCLGSTFVLAGEEFGKETDSNKIYAYSASVIALISCVVGIVALLKT